MNIEYRLKTKSHVFAVYFTGNDHCRVWTRDSEPVKIHGVEYRLSLYAYKWNDRLFHQGDQKSTSWDQRQSLYMRRVDGKDSSEAARKIGPEIISALQAFIATPESQRALAEAQTKSLQDELQCAEYEYAEAMEAADAARAIRDKAQQAIDENYRINVEARS